MFVDAGQLNKRISFVSISGTKDEEGFRQTARTTVYSCWAQVRQDSGKEVSERDGDYGIVEATFLIRYRAGLSRKLSIEYGGHDWDIEYIDTFDGGREWLKIRAKREVQAGDLT